MEAISEPAITASIQYSKPFSYTLYTSQLRICLGYISISLKGQLMRRVERPVGIKRIDQKHTYLFSIIINTLHSNFNNNEVLSHGQ
jgi:hypothetical protein